jgi:acetylornithine deacetylase/succinyl-diaminopimelate desuccinylase-like protein
MHPALQHASHHFPDFVQELVAFLMIPSISTDPANSSDVRRCAEWLADHMRSIGVQRAEVMPTDGHPIVYGEHTVDPSKPTVLIYGHYDVQPPDPLDLWTSPPFEPVIDDQGRLFARGACDDKGQLFMHVKALESYLQAEHQPPLNLKFIIEGEEESGSEHLAPFIEKHKALLKADVVAISDTSMFAAGIPSITYGLRGLAYVEVELTGPDRDLHSGSYGGGVENPINALARLIGGLHDENHRVTIPGFYDNVRDLSDEERTTLAALPFDAEAWKQETGVEQTLTEAGYSVLEGISARPTLDANGIWGGYQGKGAKTVLPSKAGAKISMRLVPDQTPEEVVGKIRDYFEQNLPPTMKLAFRNLHGGMGAIVDIDHPAMKAAAKALLDTYGRAPYFTREGGSIPVVADFKSILGLDTILMGFGLPEDAIHSPNESFGLDRFRQGILSIIRFWEYYR